MKRQSHIYESIGGDSGIAGRLNVSRATSSRSPSVLTPRQLAPVLSEPSVYRLTTPLPLLKSTATEACTGSLPNRHRLHKTVTTTSLNRTPRLANDVPREKFAVSKPVKTSFLTETQSLDRAKVKQKPKAKPLLVANSDGSRSKTRFTVDEVSRSDNTKRVVGRTYSDDQWPVLVTSVARGDQIQQSDALLLASFNKHGLVNTTSGSRRGTPKRSSTASYAVRRRVPSPSHRKDKCRRVCKSSNESARRKTSCSSAADQRPPTSGTSSAGGCFVDLTRMRSFSRHGSDDSFVTALNDTPMMPRKSVNKRVRGDIDEGEDDDVIEELEHQDSSKRNARNPMIASRRRTRQRTTTELPDHQQFSDECVESTTDRSVVVLPSVVAEYSEHANSTYGVQHRTSSVPLPLCLAVLLAYLVSGAALFVRSRRKCTGNGDTTPVDNTVIDDWCTSAFVSFTALSTIGGWYPLSAHCSPSTDDSDDNLDFQWPLDFRYLYSMWLMGGLCLVAMLVRLILDCAAVESGSVGCCRCFRVSPSEELVKVEASP